MQYSVVQCHVVEHFVLVVHGNELNNVLETTATR